MNKNPGSLVKKHRARIVVDQADGDPVYQAKCNCGWDELPTGKVDQARRDKLKHLEDVKKKS